MDENSVVTNVVALNADADVIISSEERRAEIIGKPHAQAVKVFVDYAALLGYVDLSSMGAVKITGCGEENTVVVDTVKQYFMDKGAYVAVVSASASIEDFCVLGGFSLVEGVDALVESIASTPSLLAARQSEGKTGDELEDLFVESYGDDALMASAEEFFMAEVEAVFNCSQDILLIVNKSLEIISSPDNPNIFLRDYWSILKSEDTDYTGEFAQLMADMQSMLDEFEVNYGVKIESIGQLDELASEYNSDVMIILRELFDNFDIDKFLLNVKIFSRLFEDIGKDIEEAMGLPKTVEDYLVKAGDYYKSSYEKRKAEYKAVYEGSRESISASDYDAYINNVIAQYGSLEGYWQAQKNN